MVNLEDRFEKILLEAVDETLGTLGESVKEALYFHLETKFSVNKQTICKDPSAFSDGLERIFGIGSKFIERAIIGCICKKIKYEPNLESENQSFAENIQKLKEYFVQNPTSMKIYERTVAQKLLVSSNNK